MIPTLLPCPFSKPDTPGFDFPQEPWTSIYFFQTITILATLCVMIWAWRKLPRGLSQFFTLSTGVFFFEFFTSPMWNNWNMSCWAYVYQDVSWVLTFGWAAVFLLLITFVDRRFASLSELKRFPLYLLALVLVVFFLEAWVVGIGIRSYAPEVEATLLGVKFFGVPLELFYYVPVFSALIISFHKFWMLVIEDHPIPPLKHQPLIKIFFAAVLGILLFELMIEPMVINLGMPEWSYVYHDISLVMSGVWVLELYFVYCLVNRFFISFSVATRQLLSLVLLACIAVPVEAWYIVHGYRVYGESAVRNFSGYFLFSGTVPVEVIFGIPLYFSLIIPFIFYLTMHWSGAFLVDARRSEISTL